MKSALRGMPADIPKIAGKSLRVFLIATDVVTDRLGSGDGLIAHRYISLLSRSGHSVTLVAPAIDVLEPFNANVDVHCIPYRDSGKVLRYGAFSLAVRQCFDAQDRIAPFDLVHQVNPVVTGVSLFLFGVRAKVLVGTFFYPWSAAPIHESAIRLVQQLAAHGLLLSTNNARRSLVLPALFERKIHLLSHGVDASTFYPAEQLVAAPHIVFVARLDPEKGLLDVIRALRIVADRIPDAFLTVAGDGTDRTRAEELVRELGLADRVRFLGRLSRDQIPVLMREATLYCQPSYCEPYGLSIIEAMASGLPVVSTNVGGPAELIHEDGGRLVSPGNSDDLARAMIELLSQYALRKLMGSNNRARVENGYTIEKAYAALLAAYAAVLRR